MSRRRVLGCCLFSALIVTLVVPIARSQTTCAFPHQPGIAEGTGTSFQVADIGYPAISLRTTVPVQVTMLVRADFISITMRPAGSAASTAVTISGLPPASAQHRFTDSYRNDTPFVADENGTVEWTQDLSRSHVITIMSHTGTIYLTDAGWDPPDAGAWDPVTRTATLTSDLTDHMEISGSDLTLDGAGHQFATSRPTYEWGGPAIYLHVGDQHGITIRNIDFVGWGFGLLAGDVTGLVVDHLTVQGVVGSGSGLHIQSCTDVTLTDNVALGPIQNAGFYVTGCSGVRVQHNQATGNLNPIMMYNPPGALNAVTDNDFEGTGRCDLYNFDSGLVSGNRFVNSEGVRLCGFNHTVVERNLFEFRDDAPTTLFLDCMWSADTVRWNTIRAGGCPLFVYGVGGGGSVIYNNVFESREGRPPYLSSYATDYRFNLPAPIGGNYWSAWTGPDADHDGFVDMPYVIGSLADDLPYVRAEGWLASTAVAPQPPGSCISIAHPCVAVPVDIARQEATPVRGFSVDLQLSGNLSLCGAGITQGSYLSGVGTTAFQVVDNGGGSYTVDGAILGTPCGATAAAGTLFTLHLGSVATTGTGTVTVTSVTLRDCGNAPIAAVAGPPIAITIQQAAPLAITDLAAAQVLSGNGANPTTGVRLTWATGGAGTVALYRAPFGSYPEYDDDAPVSAPNPTLAPFGPWTLVNATATSPYVDVNPARGFWHYVAIVTDACGNASAVSNMTGGTLNYLLGDVSNGVTAGIGNDMVYAEDISLLGAHYGIAGEAAVDAFDYLDVGPTITHLPDSRPKPDDRINFEDLMIFAINYGSPGAQLMQSIEAPVADHDAITVAAPGTVMAGGTFTVELRMSGAGDIQGVTSQLAWDARVATPLAVHAGELLAAANGVAFSAQPGNVDVALLGSRSQGLSGEGVLATVTFRALASGDPQVSLARVEARDAANQAVALGGVPVGPATPRETALLPVTPNPFRDAALLGFSLAKDAPVELSIYSVDGRRVATIAQGAHAAGVYHLRWDGTDTHGSRVGSGVFYARLSVAGREFTRRLVYLR